MGLSPAQVFKKQMERSQAGETSQAATVNTDSLHIKLIEFEEDRKGLKAFNAIADKVAHKRNVLIPKYKPLAEAYLASGEHYENPIFSSLIIWLFDIEDLDTAIEWCFKAIEHDLPTPEFIKSDWPSFCARSVLEWVEKNAARGHSVEPYFSQVFEKVSKDWRLHEERKAKWFKFAGLHLLRDENGRPRATSVADVETLEQSKALLTTADELYSKIGVGTVINKIDMRLSALKTGKNL